MDELLNGLKVAIIGMASVAAFLIMVFLTIQFNFWITKPFAHILDDEKQKAKSESKQRLKPDEEELNAIAAAVAAVHHDRES